MQSPLDQKVLDQLFLTARTHNVWTDAPVTDEQIRKIYNLLKFGPTSANGCPARFVWVRSKEGKRRLAALAFGSNQAKILKAPLTVIVGHDLDFTETLPRLFSVRGEKMKRIITNCQLTEVTAFRNGSLQGAYLILAARALGLDCGPMSGFDNESVDVAFFAGTNIKSNFICSIGYGTDEKLSPRNPRLGFEEVSRLA